ncbi:MAG: hypothetical protein QM673_11645 [Gordonia sp. (in: high G+C Gram-positive bacteria)]
MAATAAGAPHIYHGRHVRWVARRPPESMPPPRSIAARGPRLIPRYSAVPRWGLRDEPVVQPTTTQEDTSSRLRSGLEVAAATLAVSAVTHFFRYALLVANRSTPLPGWLITVSSVAVILGGAAALFGVVFASARLVRWIRAERRDGYRSVDRTDPRRTWLLAVLAVVPVISVVGVGLLLHEVAAVRSGQWRDTGADGIVRRRLDRIWLAWALVNALAVWAAITWVVSLLSGSIQTGADALALVAVSAAVSAVFAFWARQRLPQIFDTETVVIPDKRWVAVA